MMWWPYTHGSNSELNKHLKQTKKHHPKFLQGNVKYTGSKDKKKKLETVNGRSTFSHCNHHNYILNVKLKIQLVAISCTLPHQALCVDYIYRNNVPKSIRVLRVSSKPWENDTHVISCVGMDCYGEIIPPKSECSHCGLSAWAFIQVCKPPAGLSSNKFKDQELHRLKPARNYQRVRPEARNDSKPRGAQKVLKREFWWYQIRVC